MIHKDTTGIDLREWINDGSCEGWSKKGIRIPYQYLAKTIDYMKQTGEFLKQPKGKA
ncbi:MAG: hypothetical protein HY059_22585 [Proteobacteria bacterium]|nr:hypothetical protein [Pseudomonadota bacterium]